MSYLLTSGKEKKRYCTHRWTYTYVVTMYTYVCLYSYIHNYYFKIILFWQNIAGYKNTEFSIFLVWSFHNRI